MKMTEEIWSACIKPIKIQAALLKAQTHAVNERGESEWQSKNDSEVKTVSWYVNSMLSAEFNQFK